MRWIPAFAGMTGEVESKPGKRKAGGVERSANPPRLNAASRPGYQRWPCRPKPPDPRANLKLGCRKAERGATMERRWAKRWRNARCGNAADPK